MAVTYCDYCNIYVDLDWEAEHFDEHGVCSVMTEKAHEEDAQWGELA